MGIKSSSSKHLVLFTIFKIIKTHLDSWSSNYKKREMQNKIITDEMDYLNALDL